MPQHDSASRENPGAAASMSRPNTPCPRDIAANTHGDTHRHFPSRIAGRAIPEQPRAHTLDVRPTKQNTMIHAYKPIYHIPFR